MGGLVLSNLRAYSLASIDQVGALEIKCERVVCRSVNGEKCSTLEVHNASIDKKKVLIIMQK